MPASNSVEKINRVYDLIYEAVHSAPLPRENLLELLTEFCEGKISATEWAELWKRHDLLFRSSMGAVNYGKLKPDTTYGVNGAALVSQEAAAKILTNFGKPVNFSMSLHDDWNNEFAKFTQEVTSKPGWLKKVRTKTGKLFKNLSPTRPKY